MEWGENGTLPPICWLAAVLDSPPAEHNAAGNGGSRTVAGTVAGNRGLRQRPDGAVIKQRAPLRAIWSLAGGIVPESTVTALYGDLLRLPISPLADRSRTPIIQSAMPRSRPNVPNVETWEDLNERVVCRWADIFVLQDQIGRPPRFKEIADWLGVPRSGQGNLLKWTVQPLVTVGWLRNHGRGYYEAVWASGEPPDVP